MAEPRFVYHPDYYCDIGEHVFRTEKYGLLARRLVETGVVPPDGFLRPEPATRGQLELVHTAAYVSDLLAARHTQRTMRSEMPIGPRIISAFVLAAGGTILACRTALRERTIAMNLGGGFHHAFPDWAEGFCYINDAAVGVRAALQDGPAERAMVVDCDLHQGNGTARIFRDDPRVFTFSIHQENLYPIKERSDLDVGLQDFCSGRAYCDRLQETVPPLLDEHKPQLIVYVAGADPYEGDLLGNLLLSMEDMRRRDDIVLGACARRGVPAAVVLAGGYSPDVGDTVDLHYGTACSVVEHARRYC